MAFHGQDMEFTAQKIGITAGKPIIPMKTRLKEMETGLANS
jgi:hypothetical protein